MSDKPVTRLTSMDIEEVSVVDRAANKRRFAVIKREDAMPDGNVVLEVVEKDGEVIVKAAPPETDEAKAQREAKEKADKEAAEKAVKEAEEKAKTDKAKADADAAEKAKADEGEMEKAVADVATKLKAIFAGGKAKPEDMEKALAGLEKFVDKPAPPPAPVGSRKQVTGPRAVKLAAALKALSELAKDLGVDPPDAPAKKEDDPDVAAKAVGAAVAKALAPMTDKLKEIETAMSASHALNSEPGGKSTDVKKGTAPGFWGGITGLTK